jgi:hypothetical protein
MSATYAIFEKLLRGNNRQLGENSPNLVTLPTYIPVHTSLLLHLSLKKKHKYFFSKNDILKNRSYDFGFYNYNASALIG